MDDVCGPEDAGGGAAIPRCNLPSAGSLMTWTRAEDTDLGAVFDGMPRPWPAGLARLWLRHAEGAATHSRSYWLPKDAPAQIIASMQRHESPGRRALAHLAGWGEKQARTLLEAGAWRDPYLPPSEEGPGLVPPGAQVGSRVGPGSEHNKDGTTVHTGPGLVPPGARVGSRVGPDRARVSLDPNPEPSTQTQEADRDLTGSPPPAEPSGSLADGSIRSDLSSFSEHETSQLPTAEGKKPRATVASMMAGVCSKMEPPAEIPSWLTEPIEEFQPVSDGYMFEDAHHDGITEPPSIPRPIESPAHRAPEAPPQGPRPSPTRQGTGEGASGPAQGALWGSEASGAPMPPPPPPEPARAPPRPRKEPPAPVDLTHPDDPCLLLPGKDLKLDLLTAPVVAVYREWWRRQPSPATCRLNESRAALIRSALADHTEAQLRHLIRFAYEAADLGRYQRAWRGESGQEPPGLEMLTRKANIARNVEESGRWSVERIEGAPPADPLQANVHPFPMPPPPRPATRNFQSERFAILQEMIKENQRNAQQ
mgnify:CR=1 FL=1